MAGGAPTPGHHTSDLTKQQRKGLQGGMFHEARRKEDALQTSMSSSSRKDRSNDQKLGMVVYVISIPGLGSGEAKADGSP